MRAGKKMETARQGKMTLLQWILEQNDTEGWRTGNSCGERHPQIGQDALEAVGKRALLEQAAELERDELIRVDWREFGNDIGKIHYRLEDVDRMYRRAGLANPREELKRARQDVESHRARLKNPDFIPFYDKLLGQIDRGTVPARLKNEYFLECLNAVADHGGSAWETEFSARLFGRAKYFKEKLRSKIVPVLAEYGSGLDAEMTEDEVLAEYGIMTYSQRLECKGPLEVDIPGAAGTVCRASGACFPLGMALNAQTLERGLPAGLPGVRAVVIIENKANYESMEYRADVLYIYCHGFFSPKERRFLKGIEAISGAEMEFFHWSDMDYGGMRIYKFVKEKVFKDVKPLNMDKAAYERCLAAGAGIPLEERKRKKLETMEAPGLEELKACILQYGIEIEQENLLEGRQLTDV